jgi:hypothetical protein
MGMLWEQQHVVQVERAPPVSTGSGKFQHFVPAR